MLIWVRVYTKLQAFLFCQSIFTNISTVAIISINVSYTKRHTTYIISENADIGKKYCNMNYDGMNWLNLRHTLDRMYLTSIVDDQYIQICLHNDDKEVV